MRIVFDAKDQCPSQWPAIESIAGKIGCTGETLRSHKEICEQLWRDLYLRGLLNAERLNVTKSGNGLTQRRTTGLGEALLKFIAEPQ